jgi:transcriptional regulator with XRE-family HTH domain
VVNIEVSKKTLRQIRRERDITQEELSKKTGLSDRIISLYENDIEVLRGASYYNLEKIANALDVEIADIYLG